MNNEKRLYYSAKYHKEERDGKALFIFPEIPCWLIGTTKLEEILRYFSSGASTCDFFSDYLKKQSFNYPQMEALINSLISKNILSDDRKFSMNERVNVDNQITSFIYSITTECNLRCKSCYNSYTNRLPDELTTYEMDKMIDEVYPYLTYGFSISGGEPFCRKNELHHVLEYLNDKDANLQIGIVTNGTLITKDDAERLSKIKNLTVQVSLDGITKEAHEFNRGENSFEKTVDSIKLLGDYNVRVLLGILLTEKSLEQIQPILDFALSLGIKSVRFVEMFWQGLSRSKNLKRPLIYELIPKYKTLLAQHPEYRNLLSQDTVKITFDSLVNTALKRCCGASNRNAYVNSNGDVYPCNLLIDRQFCMGNIREKSFSDIWTNSPVKTKLNALSVDSFAECCHCELKFLCGGGCRGTAFHFSGQIDSAPPNCSEKKEAIYTFLWEMGEDESLYQILNHE